MKYPTLALAGIAFCATLAAASCRAASDSEVQTIEVDPAGEVSNCRLRLIYPRDTVRPVGVLVVMDGENQSADRFLDDARWSDFAEANGLVLCGLEMTSETSVLRDHRGYYDASRGAGSMLLEGLEEAGLSGLPIFAFGFSGGARFVGSLVAWSPASVAAWSAFSASKWIEPPESSRLPPGIVACGLWDAVRLGACREFFQEMRRRRQPLTWVSLQDHGHARSIPLEEFTRQFFSAVIHGGEPEITVDWIKEEVIEPKAEWEYFLSCSLPSPALLNPWRELNTP